VETIKKVTIKNFRSIVREEFKPARFTVFVGQNDSGKSNFLRALNLFFNGETDLGRKLTFQTDFSSLAKVGRGKAKQIEIWIDIEGPFNVLQQDGMAGPVLSKASNLLQRIVSLAVEHNASSKK
jgi:predicted ATP-dependent endonuclease of OLD family